jgi:hypothetical protein
MSERASYMHGGGWLSFERGVNPGDMRVINGVISKAWKVLKTSWFKKPRIHWVSVDPDALRKVPLAERPESET